MVEEPIFVADLRSGSTQTKRIYDRKHKKRAAAKDHSLICKSNGLIGSCPYHPCKWTAQHGEQFFLRSSQEIMSRKQAKHAHDITMLDSANGEMNVNIRRKLPAMATDDNDVDRSEDNDLSASASNNTKADADADADITYTFDRPTGPSAGRHVLNDALVRAVERFETRRTERLVSAEYEVLDGDGEALKMSKGRAGARLKGRWKRVEEDVVAKGRSWHGGDADRVDEEDDDFEFV